MLNCTTFKKNISLVSAVISDDAMDISNEDAVLPRVLFTEFKYKLILAGKLLNSTSTDIIIII